MLRSFLYVFFKSMVDFLSILKAPCTILNTQVYNQTCFLLRPILLMLHC